MSTAEESKMYRPSESELRAGLGIIRAVADTVRELGRTPRGTLYAALMGRGITFTAYEKIESILVNSGLCRIESDQLIWQA